MRSPHVLLFALLAIVVAEGASLLPGKPIRGPPPASPQVAVGQTVDLVGQLTLVNTHDNKARYALIDAEGVVTPFSADFVLPEGDKDNNPLETGSIVGMKCEVGPPKYCGCGDIGGNCTCPDDANTPACVAAAQSTISLVMSAAQVLPFAPAPHGTQQKLLVMILDYGSCGYAPSLTENDIRNLYLGPNKDGLGGIALKYSDCSYGKFGLNTTAFMAVRVSINCSTAVTSSCSWWAISQGADAAAKSLIGLAAFSTFSHFTYVLPPGLQSVCAWAGLALLPGRQTWLQSSGYGVQRWATVMQEGIHNYGLWHSWRNGWEYEDYSTAMGRGDACPNVAETSRLGWATPAVGGGAINSGVLKTAGSVAKWSLPATYITGDGNHLRVLPDWLPGYTNSTLAKNLYLALRVNKLGDAALGSMYANKVNVHEVNATMDNGYPNSFIYSDRRIQFISSVSPFTRSVLPAYNLVIYTSAVNASDAITVYLCRYTSADSQCPSLTDVVGTASPPPPSPPPPARPPPSPPPPARPPPPPPTRSPPPLTRSPPPLKKSPPPSPRKPPPSPRPSPPTVGH
ncbi:metalloproteinase, extracellular matrix glycoprotein VMP1 [Volvox carteri f. nagariensis]|uniref:Matrix metalloproteinase n=1 Tax=Volvox carteri f. nagariensis TaxID=3068 RepID=Q8S9B4_VOLCA|nr:metalloproteinase, extracellular matrix glycoprotein VMP1 [Volvox carteri f. nagariensis]EFJ49690.1 metalloproteinase, extracellular matrix glycoprotein VMP1 [Volvox carteri f. nagariensis]BAB85219.1 matrix metalloproteinase [Volvox carteri f. nagariensis]|eukprot:XP_002949197.1 metalloproteinase, extracellular matrix glycoprotein VMP1 [Volvox carteri f. nagariensis]